MTEGAPRSVLILDTETTGTDPDAVCVEIACILYSVTHATPVRSFASLIRHADNPAEAVNRIPSSALPDAPEADSVWPVVARMASKCDAFVAHGADFDRRFVPPMIRDGMPWICSMNDLDWPCAQKPGEALVKLALAHDLGVAYAHRAMAGVDLISRLFTRYMTAGLDLGAFLLRGMRPKGLFIVADQRLDAARNELAKLAGFVWDRPELVPRAWARRMAIEDAPGLPFEVREVGP